MTINPRIGGIIDRHAASATIDLASGVSIPKVFITFSASSVGSIVATRRGNIWHATVGWNPWL